MAQNQYDFKVRLITRARNDLKHEIPLNYEDQISEIIVNDRYAEGLEGIEEFSHAIIIYWIDRSEWRGAALKGHPMAKKDFPVIGFFARRSPIRPNLIDLATVKVLKRDKNIPVVAGLEAYNNTPVIDIKPYVLGYDDAREARFPVWVYRALEYIEQAKRRSEV